MISNIYFTDYLKWMRGPNSDHKVLQLQCVNDVMFWVNTKQLMNAKQIVGILSLIKCLAGNMSNWNFDIRTLYIHINIYLICASGSKVKKEFLKVSFYLFTMFGFSQVSFHHEIVLILKHIFLIPYVSTYNSMP